MPVNYRDFLNNFPVKDFVSFQDGLIFVSNELIRKTREHPSIANAVNSAIVRSIADLNPTDVENQLRLICFATYFLNSPISQVGMSIESFLMSATGIQDSAGARSVFDTIKASLPTTYILVSEFIRGCLQQPSFHLARDDPNTFVWINDMDTSSDRQFVLRQDGELSDLLASSAKILWFMMASLAKKVPAEEIKAQFLLWASTLYAFLLRHGIAAAEQLKSYMEEVERKDEAPTADNVLQMSELFRSSVSNLHRSGESQQPPLPVVDGQSCRF